MDFSWSEEEQTLRQNLRTYIEDNLMPEWSHLYRDVPTQATVEESIRFCKGLAERGLLTPAWPEEFGGRSASQWEQTIISEEIWGVGEARGPQYMNMNWIGPAIMELGTTEQKQEYLVPMTAGEALWCQGFSEPDAGSDLAALRTTAVREGGFYRVNGQKIWTSYAHAAHYCFLLVRTAKTPNPRNGISILLVPMNLEGIEIREIPSLNFPHLVHEVFFRDVKVPEGCRLGEENEGWNIIRNLLANERVGNARHEWVERSLDRVVEESVRVGVDMADSRFWEILGRAATWVAASRILNYVTVQASADESPEYSNLAAIYRVALGQMEMGSAQAFLDILGTNALLDTSRADYQLFSGIVSTIGGGSIEMALNSVARSQLDLPTV